jgi:hypothetical protein
MMPVIVVSRTVTGPPYAPAILGDKWQRHGPHEPLLYSDANGSIADDLKPAGRQGQ